MRIFFTLQFRRFRRHVQAFGLNPEFALVLIPLLFIGSMIALFSLSAWAPYVILGLALMALSKWSEVERINFLKSSFTNTDFMLIRMMENMATVLPFLVFLVIYGHLLLAALLFLATIAMTKVSLNMNTNFTIPTPFKRWPFELPIGFRSVLPGVLLTYIILGIAIRVENYNLGLASLVLSSLLFMSFFFKPENHYFVWMYDRSIKGFLAYKIKLGIGGMWSLNAPIMTALMYVRPEYSWVVIGFSLLASLYLIAFILAKYAAFPQEMNLPQVMFLAFSVWLPPLLLAVIPYFYRKSIEKLTPMLE